MNTGFRLAVEFWGVRGSTPTPEAGKLRYGGNTTCISLRAPSGERLIFDAGTGIRTLGRRLLAESPDETADVNLFFTHFHWDHIQGLPFFFPLLRAGNKVHFHSCVSASEVRSRLERQMSGPFFTLDFNSTRSQREFVQFGAGSLRCGPFNVQPFPLNHPQGACGYRVEAGGAVVVIATDVEHGHPTLDKILEEHCAHADLLAYDAQYTDVEYSDRKGWGHSTARQAALVANRAAVKQLALFHHDPDHDDEKIDGILAATLKLFTHTIAAQEGSSVLL